MTMVESIRELEVQMNVNPQDYEFNERYVSEVLVQLKEYGVNLDESSFIGFVSHVIGLLKRLRDGEEMMDLGDDILSQIDEKSFEIAKKIATVFEKNFNTELNQSEIVLLAIHIQTALSNE